MKIHTEEKFKVLMCETKWKIFFQENIYPRMEKSKIVCKEPSELKIF